jgi:TonB family protein
MLRPFVNLLLIGLILGWASPLLAADSGAKPVTRTMALPIDKTPPKYPRRALANGREGWVIVSYVVTTEGRVIDPVVEDSSGIRDFEKAALKVVKKWQYEPATYAGVAVEQCHTTHRITFKIEDSTGARDFFVRGYQQTSELLDNSDPEGAQEILTGLMQKDGLNLYETARAWLMQAAIADARDDDREKLRSYYRAGVANGEWMEPKVQAQILRAIFIMEVGNGNYAAAMKAYEQLVAMPAHPPEDLVDIENAAAEIQAQVASSATLSTPGLIERHGSGEEGEAIWYHSPLRRTIAFDEIDGKAGNFELRCEWRRYRDKVDPARVWRIPEGWGDCQIIVFGQQGTRFKLLELPDQPPDAATEDG